MDEVVNRGGRPPGTKLQRKKEAEKLRENQFQHALEDHSGGKSYKEAAQRQGVASSSVWHRDHGRQDCSTAHQSQQKLSKIGSGDDYLPTVGQKRFPASKHHLRPWKRHQTSSPSASNLDDESH